LKQFYKVLKPKGTLISISYGLPEKRLLHFQNPEFNWEVRTEKVIKLRQVTTEENEADGGPEPEYHYIYICVKKDAEPPTIVTEEPPQAVDPKAKDAKAPAKADPKKK
jgi:hypothetical protein